jgi:hypothetical protein
MAALRKKNPPFATGPSQGGIIGKLDQFAAARCVAIHTFTPKSSSASPGSWIGAGRVPGVAGPGSGV